VISVAARATLLLLAAAGGATAQEWARGRFRTVEGLIAQVRTYWVRPRLYQLIAITSAAKATMPSAARFFDSFRVLAP
jgi:hypothetical protein